MRRTSISIIAGFVALGAWTVSAQTIYQCRDAEGKVAVQDTPCNTGSKERQIRTPRYESDNTEDANTRDQVERLRTFANNCEPKSSPRCIEFDRRLSVAEKDVATVRGLDETIRKLQLQKDADIVSTRINHRIAKADYERADQILSSSYGADNFSSLLSVRSEASARMSKARSHYYSLTKKWLD